MKNRIVASVVGAGIVAVVLYGLHKVFWTKPAGPGLMPLALMQAPATLASK